MTFELVRAGLPNIAAILALAIMPIVTLAVATERHPATVQQAEPAALCPTLAKCAVILAIAAPEAVPE
jgi:hypothetical protein